MNNFGCKFYEEKIINNEPHFKCKNIQYGVKACQLKDGFCGYFEDCEYCKNQDTEKCNECFINDIENQTNTDDYLD